MLCVYSNIVSTGKSYTKRHLKERFHIGEKKVQQALAEAEGDNKKNTDNEKTLKDDSTKYLTIDAFLAFFLEEKKEERTKETKERERRRKRRTEEKEEKIKKVKRKRK